MAKKYDVCFPKKFESNGEEKTRWLNCGAVFENNGKFSLNLEVIPAGVSDPKGLWFHLFEPKEKGTR